MAARQRRKIPRQGIVGNARVRTIGHSYLGGWLCFLEFTPDRHCGDECSSPALSVCLAFMESLPMLA